MISQFLKYVAKDGHMGEIFSGNVPNCCARNECILCANKQCGFKTTRIVSSNHF